MIRSATLRPVHVSKRKLRTSVSSDKPIHEIIRGSEPISSIDTDVLILDANLTVAEAKEILATHGERIIVVRRIEAGEWMYYANPRTKVINMLDCSSDKCGLREALDLHEHTQAKQVSLAQVIRDSRDNRQILSDPLVVVDRNRVVGVIPPRYLEQAVPRMLGVNGRDDSAEESILTRGGHDRGGRRGGRKGHKSSVTGPRPVLESKPSTTTDTTTCNFAAAIAPEIVAQKTASVEVTLSAEAIELVESPTTARAGVKVKKSQKITIRLIPKRNCMAGEIDRADVGVPAAGNPSTLYFDVIGVAAGEAELWVVFCQGPVSLMTLKLTPYVIDGQPAPMAEPLTVTANAEPMSEVPRVNTMRVWASEYNGKTRYNYDVVFHACDVDKSFKSEEFVGGILDALEPEFDKLDTVETHTRCDFSQLQIELRSIGTELFRRLFPHDLQEVFWKYRKKIDHLKFYCEEAYVPWELLHVVKPGEALGNETCFLGQMGLVRWLHGHTAPTQLHIRKNRACIMIPSYPGRELASAKHEGVLLKKLVGAKPVTPPNRKNLIKLLSGPAAFDLLHFAGHGNGDERDPSQNTIELEPSDPQAVPELRDLSPKNVASLCRLTGKDGSRPIVVFNACQAGKMGKYMDGLGGFPPAFLEREVGMFVGALWSIGDSQAETFIDEFYNRLLKGDTVARATTAARAAAHDAGDATFLSYAVYADPMARVVEKPVN
jgi:hypothetical protein